ncbi:MAG: nucleoside-triphosphatase, partial [Chitinophagaceae bacterium]
GLQRILVLTIVYGNDLWIVINDFINRLTKQKTATNYSLLIGSGYVLLHLITGVWVGRYSSRLPKRIERWRSDNQYIITANDAATIILPAISKKRKRLKKGLFIIWLLLIGLYVQSYFKIGTALLPSHVSLKILLRSLIIVLGWVFIIGPLLKQLLHRWLQQKKTSSQQEVQEVLQLLPATQQLIAQCWKQSSGNKGWKKINTWSKMLLVNALHPTASKQVVILTAPIQTGKTTSLINWSSTRNDVYGILTPVVQGKRIFMNAHTKEQFPMEAIEEETEIQTVGRFSFSHASFQKAIQIIRDATHKEGWLVIDEIGPLELRGEGFCAVLKEALTIRQQKILLVVREGLAEQVKTHFNIGEAEIINDAEILKKLPG